MPAAHRNANRRLECHCLRGLGVRRLLAIALLIVGAKLPAERTEQSPVATTSPSAVAVAPSASERQLPDQPRLILSAEFDYARLPRELWRQRILLARQAGFNALTVPIPWSYHEPQPGRFLFDGQRDLGHLLDLCRRENMRAILRIGPKTGGDRELGGLPPWLLARMIHPRTYDRKFRAAVDRWFGRLVPLIAAKQAHRGGAVVLVEIEANPPGARNRVDPSYSDRLRQRAQSLGIEIPIVCAPPAEQDEPFAYSLSEGPRTGAAQRAIIHLGKARPWGEDDVVLDRSTEVVGLLARGVRWLDCRSFFGATDFDFQAAEGLPTRHDCGAPVGESGDLRPAYFALKQWLWWARGVEDILVENQPDRVPIAVPGSQNVWAWRRHSAAGKILFVESWRGATISAAIGFGGSPPSEEQIEIEPRGAWPIVRDCVLSEGVTVAASSARLLHMGKVGNRRLLLAAASRNEPRIIRLRTTQRPRFNFGGEAFAPTSGGCTLTIPSLEYGDLRNFCFTTSETVHVIAASEPLFAQAWPLTTSRGNALLIGGDVLLDVETSSGGTTRLCVGNSALPAKYRLYGDCGRVTTSRGAAAFAEEEGCWVVQTAPAESQPSVPQLEPWQQRDDNEDAQRSCDVSKWTVGSEPLTVEHLPAAIQSPYVWYRTTIDVPALSTCTLLAGGIGDRATVFMNGWRLGSLDDAQSDELMFVLPTGEQVLSFLVEHDGRSDLRDDPWPIPDHCFKGLRSPTVVLAGEMRPVVPFWQFVINDRGPDEVRRMLFSDTIVENWQIIWPGPDDMNHMSGFAWYRFGGDPHQPRVHYLVPREGTFEICLQGADDRAWIFLDAQLVGTHDNPRRARVIRVPEALSVRKERTSHSLAIVVENRSGPGGLTGPVCVGLSRREDEVRHGPWRMQVGLRGEHEGWFLPSRLEVDGAFWDDVTTISRQTVVRWYRTRFTHSGGQRDERNAGPSHDRAETPFLHLGSLQRGIIWLNGHCLGRYRNVGYDAERGVCLPSCWLGRENWIVVADLGMGWPDGAFLRRDPNSHYCLTTITIEPKPTERESPGKLLVGPARRKIITPP